MNPPIFDCEKVLDFSETLIYEGSFHIWILTHRYYAIKYIVDDLEKRFHTLNDNKSRKKSRRKQKKVICSLKDERGRKTI